MTIKHDEMVRGLKKTGADILATLTPEKVDAWHMASCIPGEAAELFDAVRKNDRENVVEELGDNQFYIEGLRQTFEITREETLTSEIIETSTDDIPGRAGDVFDSVKKFIIYNKDFDRAELVKALAYYELALAAAAIKFDITLEESLAGNIAKLGKRYEGLKYSDQAAQNRADKA